MTIVLQNKFWGLKVNDQGFEVGLTFNQVPAELVILFSAITAFDDPAVNFALQFQVQDAGEEPEPHEAAENDGPTNEDGSNIVPVDYGTEKHGVVSGLVLLMHDDDIAPGPSTVRAETALDAVWQVY